MDKKLAGLVCGIISIVSVAVFFLWGYLGSAWGKSWLVFVVGGMICAIINMVAKYNEEKKKEAEKAKKEK